MKLNGQTLSRALCLTAAALWVLFIFSNSIQPGEASGAQSLKALHILTRFLPAGAIAPEWMEQAETILRKMAHYVEFAILGCFLLGVLRSFTIHVLRNLPIILFAGLLIPLLDETIQLFVPGRDGRVSDVLLDFAGVLSGVIIAGACLKIYTVIRSRKRDGFKE